MNIPSQVTRVRMFDTIGGSLDCQFNPQTLQRVKSASWTHAPTRGASRHPRPQFVGTGSESLSATLLFDSSVPINLGGSGPSKAISQLMSWLTVPAQAQSQGTPAPPTVTFQWGTGVIFKGVLRQVSVNYLVFAASGEPQRATAAISMQALPDEPAPTNPSSGGVVGRTSALLQEGDSLASIAYQHYGDAGLWRALAIANGVDDPARIQAGATLLVPPRSDAVATTAAGESP